MNNVKDKKSIFRFIGNFGTIIGLIAIIIIFSILRPNAFLTLNNILNVLNNASLLAIIACGLTAVVIVGEFDMSIAYIASFSGVFACGLMVKQGLPVAAAILVTVAVGILFGAFNGIVVTKLNVTSVIATIGSGSLIYGLNYAYTNGSPVDVYKRQVYLPHPFQERSIMRRESVRTPGKEYLKLLQKLTISPIFWLRAVSYTHLILVWECAKE